MKIVTSTEMRKIDERAVRDFFISRSTLMENAGAAVYRLMERLYPDLSKKKVFIAAGKGNNAGDGFVAGRFLKQKGCAVAVCLSSAPEDLGSDSRLNYERLKKLGEVFFRFELAIFRRAIKSCDIIIDSIFGTGIRGTGLHSQLGSPYKEMIHEMNRSNKEIISVDIPSGIDGDSGKKLGAAVHATHTVTFGLPKTGLFLFPGQNHIGKLHVENIGFPQELLDSADSSLSLPFFLTEVKDFRGKLPRRLKSMHKGEAGHLLMIAGSQGKIGAAAISAKAAFRSGAGLLTLLTDRKYVKLIFSQLKEAFIDEFPKKETDFKKVLGDKDAIAIGPGIGFSKTSENLVKWVIHSSEAPVILDADALTIVSKHPEWLKKAKSSLILTPHPGEMARLMKKTSREVQENRLELPSSFAKKYGVFVALKGANTVVASPKGEVSINSTGNPAMATAGMGDVLTGMIAGFIGQGMEPYDAVCSAVFLHGQLADDWVEVHHASRGLIASDIIEMIPSGVEKLFFNL